MLWAVTELYLVALKINFSRTDIPMQYQGHHHEDVIIENDVWIGANAVIFKDVHIGRGAIIGAGAVVSKNVPSMAIATGVPARPLKQRQNYRIIVFKPK